MLPTGGDELSILGSTPAGGHVPSTGGHFAFYIVLYEKQSREQSRLQRLCYRPAFSTLRPDFSSARLMSPNTTRISSGESASMVTDCGESAR